VKIRQAGFALPLVLVMIVSCSVVGISAFKLFQDRGSRLQSTFARRQAVIAAESGFNWAISKLLQDTMGKRWYAFNDGNDCVTISDDNSGSTMEVFLCDVFNDRGELAHVHVFARGSYWSPTNWNSESAVCFGTVQITGDSDKRSAVILEKQILDTYRLTDIIDSNEELFSAEGNRFASGGRIFLDTATYETAKNNFLQTVKTQRLEGINLSEHVAMRPVVAILEKYIQLLNEIRIGRVANALLRNYELTDIFKLASESSLSLNELLSTLKAINGQGEELSSDRVTALTSGMTRSQRELIITYLLLKRIEELPSTTLINIKGDRYNPFSGAVKIGGLFYEKITRESAATGVIELMYDRMLRGGKKLNEINIMRTFFSILDNETSITHNFASTYPQESGSNTSGSNSSGSNTSASNSSASNSSASNSSASNSSASNSSVTQLSQPDWWSSTVTLDVQTDSTAVPLRDSLIEVARAYDWNSSRIPYGSYEGMLAMDSDVSEIEFERSLSTLDAYGGTTDSEIRSKERVRQYLDDEIAESGIAGLQLVTAQSGNLGMDNVQKDAYGSILQDAAVANGVRWMSVNSPSADTESSSENVGTLVEDLELAVPSIFSENDVIEGSLPGSATGMAGTNGGETGNPGGNNTAVLPGATGSGVNGPEGVLVNAFDSGDSASLFIPGMSTDEADSLAALYYANNPDATTVIDIAAVNSENLTVPNGVAGQVPESSLNSELSDYLAANNIPGDDAWITVGTDVPGAPVVGPVELSPPPPPPPPAAPATVPNAPATPASVPAVPAAVPDVPAAVPATPATVPQDEEPNGIM
jgi:hypothetical protein